MIATKALPPVRPRRPRPLVACLVLLGALCVIAVTALGTGDFRLSPGQVIDTLLGGGPPGGHFVVLELRLPRLLVGFAVGAALGMAGAVFQSLTRNPLGSPDVIGFTVGSASGGLLVILVFSGGTLAIALGAVGGGMLTALAVFLLALRGGIQGTRLVLVGIGISAMLEAFNVYLLSRASVNEAQSASAWLVGSLNARGWEHLRPLSVALLLLIPCALVLVGELRMLQLGDETAAVLGVRVQRSRVALMTVAVALTAVATATAGPVAFIALTAPPLAHWLTRGPGPDLVASGLMGACVLTLGDLAAQRLLAPTQLPVGVMTGVIGGGYLCLLLLTQSRAARPGPSSQSG
ncbi:MAG: iron chelate uptake ABC transporter family permease subunit [Streptosporangiaceae bacterium]